MANTVDQAFETIFEGLVKQAYQRKGMALRPFVRVRDATQGDTLSFNKLGKGTATQKLQGGDIVPMNVVHSAVTVTTENWYAAEYVEDLDQLKTSVNLQKEYSLAAAAALGRKHDDIIVDGWVASGANSTSLASLTTAGTQAVLEALRNNNADMDDDLFFIIGPAQASDLGTQVEFTSVDYSSVNPMDNNKRSFSWNGFDFLVMNDLPIAAGVRSCWAGSKSATGFAINSDVRTSFSWSASKHSNILTLSMSVGAGVIDSDGLLEVQITE